jgi:RNA polymerase sigma-70 factor (ECF subfamily)
MGDALPPALTRLADEDLLTLVERGDPDAFEVIYERHSRVAYSLAFRLLGDRQLAEDLVQDAFLAVWRGAAGYASARGSVRNWMLSILHNRGVDRLRTLGAMSRRQDALEQMELRRPDEPDAAELAISHALAGTVRDELRELPSEQSEVLRLAYYGGFTHEEISQMLQLPLGTVKSRMRLGLERLRRGIGETGVATA